MGLDVGHSASAAVGRLFAGSSRSSCAEHCKPPSPAFAQSRRGGHQPLHQPGTRGGKRALSGQLPQRLGSTHPGVLYLTTHRFTPIQSLTWGFGSVPGPKFLGSFSCNCGGHLPALWSLFLALSLSLTLVQNQKCFIWQV